MFLNDCPEDCNDFTYSSVVFGGNISFFLIFLAQKLFCSGGLSASEVASFVRTDWEEDKEKRLSQFMVSL